MPATTLHMTSGMRGSGMSLRCVWAASVAAETSNSHSDQADASEGESGQVNIHTLI
jgi:hypothetical protein